MANRDTPLEMAIQTILRKAHLHHLLGALQKGEQRVVVLLAGRVLELEVPVAGLFIPAMSHRTLRDNKLATVFVNVDELPIPIRDPLELGEFRSTQETSWNPVLPILLQLHEEGAVCIPLAVVEEVGGLLFMMELFQDDMSRGHPECAITASMERNPLIRVFADLTEIGREDHRLRAVVP